MRFFREFQDHGRFVKSLKVTFLVLIPKKRESRRLKGLQAY